MTQDHPTSEKGDKKLGSFRLCTFSAFYPEFRTFALVGVVAALIGKWVRLLSVKRMPGTQPQRASGEGARRQSSATLPAFLCAISETLAAAWLYFL